MSNPDERSLAALYDTLRFELSDVRITLEGPRNQPHFGVVQRLKQAEETIERVESVQKEINAERARKQEELESKQKKNERKQDFRYKLYVVAAGAFFTMVTTLIVLVVQVLSGVSP